MAKTKNKASARKTAAAELAIENRMAAAMLKLLASQPWSSLTLEAIAKNAKISIVQAQLQFKSKIDIINFVIGCHDRATAAAIDQAGAKASPHDKFFDALMARFDSLQADRQAFLNLIAGVRHDPKLAVTLACALRHSMTTIAGEIDEASSALKRKLTATALLVIYISTLYVWQRDQSSDLTRTMATLDRALHRTGKLSEMIFRGFSFA
jgi:AcrR family transcriptional regulator